MMTKSALKSSLTVSMGLAFMASVAYTGGPFIVNGQGISDAGDNCPMGTSNQADRDGVGDGCDPDIDDDGIMNAVDECPFLPTTTMIIGTEGDDILVGTATNDLIRGLSGHDIITGQRGDDCIVGGPGNDRLNGNAGSDILYGDKGNDTMTGGSGNDTMMGGLGNDRIDGGLGADLFSISAGDVAVGRERIRGGSGGDTLVLEVGMDVSNISSGTAPGTVIIKDPVTRGIYNIKRVEAIVDP